MKNSIKVSIVVPVYKVESYLDRCLNSLVSQTYSNLEIILVDDGSPDNCGEICDKWSESDSRIKSFHKANGGLSDARNYGTSKATGEYILFVDSDDYVASNIVEKLVSQINKFDADVVCCDYIRTSGDDVKFEKKRDTSPIVLDGRDACIAMAKSFFFLTTAWANLIRIELVKKYPFPVGKNQEDEATTYKYYYDSECVVVLPEKLYAYYQNPNGIMNTNSKRNDLDLIAALSGRLQFFKDRNERELYQITLSRYTKCLVKAIKNDYIDYTKDEKNFIVADLKNKRESFKFRLFILLFLFFGKKALKYYK